MSDDLKFESIEPIKSGVQSDATTSLLVGSSYPKISVDSIGPNSPSNLLREELAKHQRKQRLAVLEHKLAHIKDKQAVIRQEFQSALERYNHGVQTRRKYDDLIEQVHKLEILIKPIAVRNGLLLFAPLNILLDTNASPSSSAYRRVRGKVDHDLVDLEHTRSKLLEELLVQAQRKETRAISSDGIVTPKRKSELRELLLNHPPIPSVMATLNRRIAECRATIAAEQKQLDGLRAADRRMIHLLLETQQAARQLLTQNHQQWANNTRLHRSFTASHYAFSPSYASNVGKDPIRSWFIDQMWKRIMELRSTEFLFLEAIRRQCRQS